MALVELGGPIEQGARTIPPVNKFNAFLDNYLNQVQKEPLAVLGTAAGIAIDRARDNTPVMNNETIADWNKRVPGLNIPSGTREATGKAILGNQMKSNILTAVSDNPQNNGVLALAGKVLGGTQRFIVNPTNVLALTVGGVVASSLAEGAALVGEKFLPEIPTLGRFFPELVQKATSSGLEGLLFGFVEGLISNSAEAARRKELEGEETSTREIVQKSINEAAVTGAGGFALDVAASGISKGFKILKGKFNDNPVMDEELQRRTEAENKTAFQDRVSQISENHKDAALENNPKAKELVDSVFDKTNQLAIKFKKAVPENQQVDSIISSIDEIKKSDIPSNQKMNSLAMVQRNLKEIGGGILEKNFKSINRDLNAYGRIFQVAKSEHDQLASILSDFRVVTPDDFSNIQKMAISQMEDGRAADAEPYINEMAVKNSQILNDRLQQAGFNRGRVLHAVLDSLDVIKERQNNLSDTIDSAKDLLKETKDKSERSLIKGVINGRQALHTITTHDRAVHELLATAITNGFKPSSGVEISSFLANQVTKDADFIGGYGKLIEDLNGEPVPNILARVEEKPEAFTPESKEEIKIEGQKKELARPIVQAAFKCLIGE